MKQESVSTTKPSAYKLKDIAGYTLAIILLWLLLTEAKVNAWIIGIGVIPMATLLYLFLLNTHRTMALEPTRFVFSALPKFFVFFFLSSLRGGWDTARMALTIKPSYTPGFIEYVTRINDEPARMVFLNLICLLPGTLTVEKKGSHLLIHALDLTDECLNDITQCEEEVEKLFGIRNKMQKIEIEQKVDDTK